MIQAKPPIALRMQPMLVKPFPRSVIRVPFRDVPKHLQSRLGWRSMSDHILETYVCPHFVVS